MKKKYVELLGKCFKLNEDAKSLCKNLYMYKNELRDVYKSYSYDKARSFEKWKNWFSVFAKANETNYDMRIKSHNCNYYSLIGIVETEDKIYYFFITYANNYIWIDEK